MSNKIKTILSNDAVFYGAMMILVALTAYGLGRHAAVPLAAAPATAEVKLIREAPAPAVLPVATSTQSIVASKNGSKYHLSTCPGAGQIKEENKVWFDSAAAARAAGYTPAANCAGLE